MSYRFLRYLRLGASTLITQREGDSGVVVRPPVSVSAGVDQVSWADPEMMSVAIGRTLPGPALSVYGPGDVVAIDNRQVLRVTPALEDPEADPNLLCSIEFRHPGLPWLMTPFAPAATTDTLRPWIALVVVPVASSSLTPATGLPPRLNVGVSELPRLDEAHAWAHVQVSGVATTDDIAALIARDRSRALSRLLCPRRLQPRTRYRACVVPTFDAGRCAPRVQER